MTTVVIEAPAANAAPLFKMAVLLLAAALTVAEDMPYPTSDINGSKSVWPYNERKKTVGKKEGGKGGRNEGGIKESGKEGKRERGEENGTSTRHVCESERIRMNHANSTKTTPSHTHTHTQPLQGGFIHSSAPLLRSATS